MKEALTFDDVNIVPGFSDIDSRDKVDLSSTIVPNCTMTLPVIAANMDTIVNENMARTMLNHGAQACLHRFQSIEDTVKMFKNSFSGYDHLNRPMISIGLGQKELERADALYNVGCFMFVIDVAHGAQLSVVKQARRLREIIESNGRIIVGNFASGKSVADFVNHFDKVDSFKVGIGPGAACTTRLKTGVGVPQFTAIQEVSNTLKGMGMSSSVIADGGLKTSGDIAKALGAGASSVMVGSMLAGTDEAPGEVIETNCAYKNQDPFIITKHKKYRGSASQESYDAQGKVGKHRTAEGESFLVPYKGPVANVLQDIEGGLRSSFTYVGALNLKEFQEKVEFVKVTHAGHIEGHAHGKQK